MDPTDPSISPQLGGINNFPCRLARERWSDRQWSSLVERFEKHATTGRWTGYVHPNGYGRVKTGLESPKYVSAHIIAHVIACGERPEGYEVRHGCLCGKLCCDDSHLYLSPTATPPEAA